MKKIAVLGGAGFIGSHLVEEAIACNLEVIVFDNLSSGYLKNIQSLIDHKAITFIQGDIQNTSLLSQCFDGVDTVFHLAALTSVPESIQHPERYLKVNSIGTFDVLNACLRAKIKNIVFSSSAAIYGDNPMVPKVESMRAEPKSMYAISKLDGELYCQLFKEQHQINATALRYFNVFGPRQDPNSAYAAAIPIFIDRALRNEPITIYGDGAQTRDFIYVKDVVQANFLAATTGSDVLNVAYGKKTTIRELAQQIITLTQSKSQIEHQPERPGDIKHSIADNQKIRADIGFKAISSLQQGLSETVAYFANKQKGIVC